MIATHKIQEISFNEDIMSVIVDGRKITISLNKISSKLLQASELQRKFYKVSPSGYGIHWPLIDEDLSVDALLKDSIQE